MCRGGVVLRAGLAISTASLQPPWVDYVALGGHRRLDELISYLNDEVGWSRHQHDVAAQALNERCVELNLGFLVAYADELHP